MEFIVIYITAPDMDTAAGIGRALVEERLAACANIVPGLRSIYHWEGKVQDDPEVLMVVKTRREKFQALAERVRELHPYSVPEVIATPIVEGSESYLAWLEETT